MRGRTIDNEGNKDETIKIKQEKTRQSFVEFDFSKKRQFAEKVSLFERKTKKGNNSRLLPRQEK